METVRSGDTIKAVIEFDELLEEEKEVAVGLYRANDNTEIFRDESGEQGNGCVTKIDEEVTTVIIEIDGEVTTGLNGEYYLDFSVRNDSLSFLSGVNRTIPVEIIDSVLNRSLKRKSE